MKTKKLLKRIAKIEGFGVGSGGAIFSKCAVACVTLLPSQTATRWSSRTKYVGGVDELWMSERQAVWELVGDVRSRLVNGLTPDGFGIGFSDVAGTEDDGHRAHIHIVPRRRGEEPDLPTAIE